MAGIWCLALEPANSEQIGDKIKAGRGARVVLLEEVYFDSEKA